MAKRREGRRRGPHRPCDVPWDIRFYVQPDGIVPARVFLRDVGVSARAEFRATLEAVAVAPPPAFSGGLRWQSMRGRMSGYFYVRTKDEKQLHRLFCLLERRQPGLSNCSIIVLTGMTKPVGTAFSDAEYSHVLSLGSAYRQRIPRRVV